MSRTVRKQLMEISDTLQKANELLANLFQGTQNEDMINLLTDCQNCAITMGNKIEAVYGTGTESVHALEDYCESIYQISQHLDQLPECMEIYETSKEQLRSLRKHMEAEIPDKQEVVFMPYKASMWDALESVYLAAKEDENCEAYVVPIPYFDRKADKTLGEMHYEGAEYPKNIPITDWEDYHFEERLPDVIYIHNAYDDSNLVTCVHPRFFSSNLKKYTEKLVYIPYFVLEEIDPGDQKKIDGIKHFCFLPGIVNADKVILQSENMRQIYMNEYTKVIESAGGSVDRKQLEEKFLGTGSPKFDKVLNTKKEDLEIPEDWLRIIKKPDGSFKKIIFYNTSVAALLQHNEKMLTKMKYVFSVFKEHQDDVALLWRPHPLIKTTIESMRPQLWEEYSKIVEQYKEEGWGIYDDTADMNRAVILCDGYYGDESSIVQLLVKLEKKVVIQKVNQQNKISIFRLVRVGDQCFFNGKFDKYLYRLENSENNLFLVKEFNIDVLYNCFAFGETIEYSGNVFFFPYYADKVAIYNIKKKNMEYIYNNKLKNAEIKKAIRHENRLFLLNMSMKKSLVFDLTTYRLDYLSSITNDDLEEYEGYFHRDVCKRGNSFFCPSKSSGSIIEYNMKRHSIFTHKVCCEGEYATIAWDGKFFWITGTEKCIIKWNPEANECKRIHKLPEKLVKKSGTYNDFFSCSIQVGNCIFFFPLAANMIVKINTETEIVEEVLQIEENLVCWCAEKISEREIFFELSDIDNNMAVYSAIINVETYEVNSSIFDKGYLKLDETFEVVTCLKRNIVYENIPTYSDIFLKILLPDR